MLRTSIKMSKIGVNKNDGESQKRVPAIKLKLLSEQCLILAQMSTIMKGWEITAVLKGPGAYIINILWFVC